MYLWYNKNILEFDFLTFLSNIFCVFKYSLTKDCSYEIIVLNLLKVLIVTLLFTYI